jgi:transposase-like protein
LTSSSRKIVTDQLRSYPAAKAEIPELADFEHVFVKACARVNNRAENTYQPTRERERRMRGFRDPERTQAFLPSFGPATLRTEATSTACVALPKTTRRPLCRVASFHRA